MHLYIFAVMFIPFARFVSAWERVPKREGKGGLASCVYTVPTATAE